VVSLQAPNQDALLFKDRYESWETEHNCKVTTGTRETFMDLFDDDDTLEYEPATTAALIFTGGDEEAEKEALEVSYSRFVVQCTLDMLASHALACCVQSLWEVVGRKLTLTSAVAGVQGGRDHGDFERQ